MKYYIGINKNESHIEATLDDLKQWYQWDEKPFIAYTGDLVSMTNEAWGISKGQARKNPAIKLPKNFDRYDFFVIQYGKQVHPHTPKICLYNPALFGLLKGEYKPASTGWKFFMWMDFINNMGIFREKDVESIIS